MANREDELGSEWWTEGRKNRLVDNFECVGTGKQKTTSMLKKR